VKLPFLNAGPFRLNNFVVLALAAALAYAAPLRAQTTDSSRHNQQEKENLPSAPSALVLSQQDEALGKPAGSGFTFKAPATIPGPDHVSIEQPTDTPLPLSLDDAISLGLERNVRLVYDRTKARIVRGERLGVINALLPSLRATASSTTEQINLAAMGFKPQSLGPLLSEFGLGASSFPTIVKVNVTQALLTANQDLFDLPAWELYQGSKRETEVVDLDVLTSRGDLILAVGEAYLQVLADQTSVTNARAQEDAAKTLFSQASQRRQAGVGTSLDELRGQVEYQMRQQGTIAAENKLAKDIIQLNRIMGLPANQMLELTDAAPLAEFNDMDLNRAKDTAYRHRKDLLSLQAQILVADRELRAVRYQRLPTLAFNGFYGVIGETTGLYHGVFTAEGSLRFPIFREAEQRGQQDQVNAQLLALHQREADLRVTIDAQIRASMLDVQAADQLVKVGQSNVQLAQQELSDERDRFRAGVEDNLAVVDAEASLTSAQSQLVQALYQFNVAKLNLARNTGVIETRYRTYLGD
jgi:outer membrane protein TolC